MNKLLGKIVNDKRIALGVVVTGFTLSVIGNMLGYIGVYYAGVKKGVDVYGVEE